MNVDSYANEYRKLSEFINKYKTSMIKLSNMLHNIRTVVNNMDSILKLNFRLLFSIPIKKKKITACHFSGAEFRTCAGGFPSCHSL